METSRTNAFSNDFLEVLQECAGLGGTDKIDAQGDQKKGADRNQGLVNQVVEVPFAGTDQETHDRVPDEIGENVSYIEHKQPNDAELERLRYQKCTNRKPPENPVWRGNRRQYGEDDRGAGRLLVLVDKFEAYLFANEIGEHHGSHNDQGDAPDDRNPPENARVFNQIGQTKVDGKENTDFGKGMAENDNRTSPETPPQGRGDVDSEKRAWHNRAGETDHEGVGEDKEQRHGRESTRVTVATQGGIGGSREWLATTRGWYSEGIMQKEMHVFGC